MKKICIYFASLCLLCSCSNVDSSKVSKYSFVFTAPEDLGQETTEVFTNYKDFKVSDYAGLKVHYSVSLSEGEFQENFFVQYFLAVTSFNYNSGYDFVTNKAEISDNTLNLEISGYGDSFCPDSTNSKYYLFNQITKKTSDGNLTKNIKKTVIKFDSYSSVYFDTVNETNLLYTFSAYDDFSKYCTDHKEVVDLSAFCKTAKVLFDSMKTEQKLIGVHLKAYTNSHYFLGASEDTNELKLVLSNNNENLKLGDNFVFLIVNKDFIIEKINLVQENNFDAYSESYEKNLVLSKTNENGYVEYSMSEK